MAMEVYDVAARTPVEIARRCRLYALPKQVWPLVDDEKLPLRQAETIAGIAGVEAPWMERVQAMIDAAEGCVEETWSKAVCREKVDERRSVMGSSEGGPVEEAVEDLVGRAEELLGERFDDEGEARAALEERLGAVEAEVEELEARATRLDELSERLGVGIEERFPGGSLDGFDSRKTYCSYCGQDVPKEDIGEVKQVVEDEKGESSCRSGSGSCWRG